MKRGLSAAALVVVGIGATTYARTESYQDRQQAYQEVIDTLASRAAVQLAGLAIDQANKDSKENRTSLASRLLDSGYQAAPNESGNLSLYASSPAKGGDQATAVLSISFRGDELDADEVNSITMWQKTCPEDNATEACSVKTISLSYAEKAGSWILSQEIELAQPGESDAAREVLEDLEVGEDPSESLGSQSLEDVRDIISAAYAAERHVLAAP